MHDDVDDLFLEATGELAGELTEAPVKDLPERLQAIVQHTLLTGRSDGTWPPAELLGEVVASYLDAFDERLRAEGVREADLVGDPPPPWLTALRECADHPAILQRMLDELRDHDDTAGIPNYPPPPELRLIIDP